MTSLFKIYKPSHVISSPDVITIQDDPVVDYEVEWAEASAASQDDGGQHELQHELQHEQYQELQQAYHENIRRTADKLLEDARLDAAAIMSDTVREAGARREQILRQAEEEAETLRTQAAEQGFQAGIEAGQAAMGEQLAQLNQLMQRLDEDYAQFICEYDQNLKTVAFEIASRVLQQKLEEDETVLCELVHSVTSEFRSREWATVDVSKEMKRLIARLEEQFAERESGHTAKLRVQPVDRPSGTIIIETPDGLLDISVQSQLDNLKALLQEV